MYYRRSAILSRLVSLRSHLALFCILVVTLLTASLAQPVPAQGLKTSSAPPRLGATTIAGPQRPPRLPASSQAPTELPPLAPLGTIGGSVITTAISGTLAFVGEGAGLRVLDVSNAAMPVQLAHLSLPSVPRKVVVDGNRLYIADGSYGFYIVDVSKPTQPVVLVNYPDAAHDLAVAGTIVYVATGSSELHLVDVSTPATPVLRGNIGWGGPGPAVLRVAVANQRAYVGLSFVGTKGNYEQGGLAIVDVSQPDNPQHVTTALPSYGGVTAVTVVNSLTYVLGTLDSNGQNGLAILDVTQPMTPTLLGSTTSVTGVDIQVKGTVASVAGSSGLTTIDVSDAGHPTVLSTFTTNNTSAVRVAGDLAYVAAGIAGLQIVNISSPQTMHLVGHYAVIGRVTDVQVVGSLAYLVTDRGLQIVDVSDSMNTVLRGSYAITPQPLALQVVGNLVYVVGVGGLQIVDVTTPTSPILRGSIALPGIARRVSIVGSHAYIADDQAGLAIVDVTYPTGPQIVSIYHTKFAAQAIQVINNLAYLATWGYPPEDSDGGLEIIDVSNPQSPQLAGASEGFLVSANGIQIVGHYAYLSEENDYITTYRLVGMGVYDITSPSQPVLLDFTNDPNCDAYDTALGGILAIGRTGVLADCDGVSFPNLLNGPPSLYPAIILDQVIMFEGVYLSTTAVSMTTTSDRLYIAAKDQGVRIYQGISATSWTFLPVIKR